MENNQSFAPPEANYTGLNFKDVLINFLKHWLWFLFSILFCLVSSFIYLRYQIPIYQVKGTVLIRDDKKVLVFLKFQHSKI